MSSPSTKKSARQQQSKPAKASRRNSTNKKKQHQQQSTTEVDSGLAVVHDDNDDDSRDDDIEGKEQEATADRVAASRKSHTKKDRLSAQSSSTSSSSNESSVTPRLHTRSITAAAEAIVASSKATAKTASVSKKRKHRKRRVQEDAPYRPSSVIAKAYPDDRSMQLLKKQKREHRKTVHESERKEIDRRESDLDVEMQDTSATTTKSNTRNYKSKKRSNMFQVCDRDALSHVYSYLTRVEFALVILVSRHWNCVGSMRACWPPYTRETILQRYINSIVGAGEYDDSVLHPRRVEPKGIFDLQRLIRAGGTYSQVNDLAFDEEYYANPSPLIELTKLKNLTSLKYTIEDITQLNLFQPFAEVMSHRLLILKLIMNHETQEDSNESDEYTEAHMTRHEIHFAPIGLLVKLRVLVTNTLPPDSILARLHSLEFLQCPTDCHLHPYTARVIRYLSVRHHLRHLSLDGEWIDQISRFSEGLLTCAANFIAILCAMPWKDTLKLIDETEEEREEKEEEEEQNNPARPHHVPRPSHPSPWYVDPIPADDLNQDLPIAQLTSLWLGNNHSSKEENNYVPFCVRDFISLFSMSTLRHLRCQISSRRRVFPAFAVSDASTSIAATRLVSLDIDVGHGQIFTGLSYFTSLRHLSIQCLCNHDRHNPPDFSQVFPQLTQLCQLTLHNVHRRGVIDPATWQSMSHLRELRCLKLIQSNGWSGDNLIDLFNKMVVYLSQIPHLQEVHMYEECYYVQYHDIVFELPPQLLTAVSSSPSWQQLHYHPLGDSGDSSRYRTIFVLPHFDNGKRYNRYEEDARLLLTHELTSNPRIQQFRLHLYDPLDAGKLQSICRLAMPADEDRDDLDERQLRTGWVKEEKYYDSDEEVEII